MCSDFQFTWTTRKCTTPPPLFHIPPLGAIGFKQISQSSQVHAIFQTLPCNRRPLPVWGKFLQLSSRRFQTDRPEKRFQWLPCSPRMAYCSEAEKLLLAQQFFQMNIELNYLKRIKDHLSLCYGKLPSKLQDYTKHILIWGPRTSKLPWLPCCIVMTHS